MVLHTTTIPLKGVAERTYLAIVFLWLSVSGCQNWCYKNAGRADSLAKDALRRRGLDLPAVAREREGVKEWERESERNHHSCCILSACCMRHTATPGNSARVCGWRWGCPHITRLSCTRLPTPPPFQLPLELGKDGGVWVAFGFGLPRVWLCLTRWACE